MRAAVVAMLAAALAAQRARVINLAPTEQFGWVDVAVPQRADIPARMVFGDQKWTAVRGRDVGRHSTILHVFVPGIPGAATVQGRFTPSDRPVPAFHVSPVIREITSLIPQPVFRLSNRDHRPEVDVLGVIDRNAARQLWHVRSRPVQGLLFEAWIDIRSGQCEVPIAFTVTWSDRDDPAWVRTIGPVRLESRHEIAIDFEQRIGASHGRGENRWVADLFGGGQIGDGEQLKYRGTILCRQWPRQAGPLAERLRRTLDARKRAPLRGVCLDWDGHWLAFGRVPERPSEPGANANQRYRRFLARIAERGTMFDQRPLSGTRASGQTGGQVDFGSAKDGMLLRLGDPRLLWELEYSDSYYFRGFHHRERDGSRLLEADHPKWFTWSMYTDPRNGPDVLGKTAPRTWGMRAGASGWSGADDQHRSQNYELALWALSGCPMLENCFLDCLETDLAQVPNRPGAPRAMGRLMLTWANMLLLLPEAERERLRVHADQRLAVIERSWRGRRFPEDPNRPVRILATVRDNRVIADREAWMPWQEALATIGFHAMWKVTGEPRYRRLARSVAEAVTRFATFEDARGRWHCCTGVRYLTGEDEGKPLPESSYRLNSPDLLISNSFWTWTLPAVLICRELTESAAIRERANRIVRAIAPNGPPTWPAAEWWACARVR